VANLGRIGERTRFSTRLPATYDAHARGILRILRAIEADAGIALGAIEQPPPAKNRPGASYRVHAGKVNLYCNDYREVVVHSTRPVGPRPRRRGRRVGAAATADDLELPFDGPYLDLSDRCS
jgi:hypothetical protein